MRVRLWHKLLVIVVLILIGAIGGLTFFTYQATREAMFEEFNIRGRELAKAIASESMNYYQTQDVEGFTTLLQSLGEAEGVLAILAYTGQAHLWVESSIIELASSELALTTSPARSSRESLLPNGMRVTEFFHPVPFPFLPQQVGPPETQGWIRVILDRQSLEARLILVLWRTLGISVFIMAVGGGLVFVLLRQSLKVITPLTDATQQVASGRLDISVPVHSNDELGQLATGFNQMTERLHQTTVSKEYLDSILKSMIDPLIVLKPNRTIQTVNQATLNLLGFNESDLVGQKADLLFPPDQNPMSGGGFDALLSKGTIEHTETSYQTKDGKQIPVLFSAALMHDGEGRMEGIACVAQDITTRKQAEDELRLSHGLLESIHRAKADFIASSDPHTTFQELLSSLLPLTKSTFGLLAETGEDKTSHSRLKTHALCTNVEAALTTTSNVELSRPPNEEDDILQLVDILKPVHEQVLVTGQAVSTSFPRQHSQTTSLEEKPVYRLTAVLSLPIFSHDQLVGLLTLANGDKGSDEKTINDLQPILSTCGHLIEAYRNEQRRIQAEAALQESVERFDMAVRGSRDGLWDAWAVSDDWFDPQNPVYFSPRFKALLGFKDHEFENVLESWVSRLHPEDRERAFRDLEAHLRQSIPYDSEYRMITKDGECRWYAGRGEAVRDDTGRPVRISGSFTDITERKQAQAELEKANARLKELDQLRSQFFADISHELRTPLTVIRGEAEVTLRGKDKPITDYKTSLERIVQLTEEVNKLVSDLLFLARSETGTIQITKSEVSLENLLQDVLQEATILAQKKHSMVTLLDLPAPSRIYGDPQRLKQLLLILLDNAIKYSDPNSHIQMGLNVDAQYATIEIVDQGQGIAEQDLPHIFDRFYRGHRVKDHTQPGAGLGLAIAKWITEAHGGHISFSSRPGEGSTATIRFPQQSLASEIQYETTPHRG